MSGLIALTRWKSMFMFAERRVVNVPRVNHKHGGQELKLYVTQSVGDAYD